ncbi:PaaI family thioesterase [Siccirubricoccus sp. KC 17139]|uniref:PaaI family thioesterase n=1 Tax=Siccirubricoccus soli TaxID=2899147 RepID=A0ABT1DC08_9PROT|nr:PaaI family thioesterase [Siccirubricoccus soli]MCO6419473.1 PaaI family thioesterase [Siccirubricoccus soli]MCP2685608.1 PaaI family thioesterase [Siccirubricoccus soli]
MPDLQEMQAIIHRGVPLAAAWGVELLAAEGGTALLRLPFRKELLRPGNTISGPALMGLADVAMWAALLSLTEGRDESVTSSMNVNFLRPAGAVPVLAEARLIKRGKRMVYGEILLRAEGSEELCAHITTHWAVITPSR